VQYAVGEIARDVRVALDENEAQTALIANDSDSLQLDGLIMQKIIHAIRDVSLTAPVAMLSDAPQMETGRIAWGDGECACGSVSMPDDFLRLVAFRMSDWQRSASAPIYETDADYSRQRSLYDGVRGNTIKPVVAIVEASGGRRLEFYSCDSKSATVSVAKYIPVPVVVDDRVAVCSRIYNAVVYYTAGLTAAAVGSAAAESLFKIANDQI
jgi:hypothetical protein